MVFTGQSPANPTNPADSAGTGADTTQISIGIIVRQRPAPGSKIRIGETIDLWVSGTEEDYLKYKEGGSDTLNLENVLNNNR